MIYKLDSKVETNNIKKLATILTKYTFNDTDVIKSSMLPNPRDGHSAHIYAGYMIVFGGDRNRFPFNDLFAFKLE